MRALIAIIRLHTRSSPARDDNTRADTLKKVSVGRSDGLFILHVPHRAHNSYKHVVENLFQRAALILNAGERKKWVLRKSRCSSNWKRVSRCWVRARGTCAERCVFEPLDEVGGATTPWPQLIMDLQIAILSGSSGDN